MANIDQAERPAINLDGEYFETLKHTAQLARSLAANPDTLAAAQRQLGAAAAYLELVAPGIDRLYQAGRDEQKERRILEQHCEQQADIIRNGKAHNERILAENIQQRKDIAALQRSDVQAYAALDEVKAWFEGDLKDGFPEDLRNRIIELCEGSAA